VSIPGDEITFYIPARNAAKTLADCLDSVMRQTCPPKEILVVADTASRDDTLEIARGYSAVRVVEHEDSSLGVVRNLAISEASTTWLAGGDADVILSEDWLESLAPHMDSGAAAIGGRIEERISSPVDEWRAINLPHHWGDAPLRNPYMLTSTGLFDRRALLTVGGYREDLTYHEDSELCGRLRDAGFELAYEPSATAMHYRIDTLHSLLNLRWNYSRYRQSPYFDHLAGLARKTAVNREYAMTTLGRVLATGNETLAYISFLLFYHHAVRDLRELLHRRPLVSTSERQFCEQQLIGPLMASLGQVDDQLANLVAEDLTGRPADPVVAGPLLYSPPKWNEYLEIMYEAAAEFADEFSHDIRALIHRSGDFLHNRVRGEHVPSLPQPPIDRVQTVLDRLTPRAILNDEQVRRWRQVLGDPADLFLAGPADEADRELLDRHFRLHTGSFADIELGQNSTLAVLHLEADAEPLGRLELLATQADRLVIAYATPELFLPSLEPLRALDLASGAAGAGMEILSFDTYIGTTMLVLRRKPSAESPAEESRVPAFAM